MSGYDKLLLVDEYEDRHGNRAAVLLACDVMVAYLSHLKRALPDVAARAVNLAHQYTANGAGADRLRDMKQEITFFLKEHDIFSESDDGAISVVRASGALLGLLQTPSWGGGASEALSYFLEWTDKFEQDHPLFEKLLEQTFVISE